MSLEDIEKEYDRKYGNKPVRAGKLLGSDPEELKKIAFKNAKKIHEHRVIIENFLNSKGEAFFKLNLCPFMDFENMALKGKQLKYLGYRINCATQFNIDAIRYKVESPHLKVVTEQMTFGFPCPNRENCPLEKFVRAMREKELEELPKRKRKELEI